MGANGNVARMSPRQKMINLMYIVLTAMLALNVSSDVLNGFTLVEDGLKRTNSNVSDRNAALYMQLEEFTRQNPQKGKPWLDKAADVRRQTLSLYKYIDSLKLAIVRDADGVDGKVDNILNQDNLEASSKVMVTYGNGAKLERRLAAYRKYIAAYIADPKKQAAIQKALATEPVLQKGSMIKVPWVSGMFENMPVVASVTLLSKLQNDLLFAEGEALQTLVASVDAGDVRVNKLDAFVIPNSKLVMRGGKYSADIVLAAVDTTQRPAIFVNGRQLPANTRTYEFMAGQTGTFTYSGYLDVTRGDGTTSRYPFQSDYTVIEPTATVSATMMNVLYAGINNPISISVPGVAQNAVSATMTNGSLTRSGDHWNAHPTRVGAECVITVTATLEGRSQTVSTSTFRVRKLPDPTAYIAYKDSKGNENHYKGSKPFAKSLLLAANGLDAAIDDDLLNVHYSEEDFETIVFDSMGNAMPEKSAGSRFSERQKTSFRRLSRGKRFYITRIRAKGPDGIVRDLSPMEVIVN
uniref:type IX secretion system motor protein PorM/GldM n=1 Tax=Candidatus Limisoma sp. TaxID=3076476 RepID=UPI003FF138D1